MRRCQILFIVITLSFATACAPKVSVLRIKPAKYKIEAVRAVGILPLATSAGENQSGGEYITESLYKSLQWRKFFDEVKHVAPKAGLNYHQVKDMPAEQAADLGREAHIDVLVKGDVFAFRAREEKSTKHIEREEGTGQYRTVTKIENGEKKSERVEIMKKIVEDIPVVAKKAEVGFVLDVANIAEKRWTDHERFYKSKQIDAEGREKIDSLPADGAVLTDLASALVTQAADSFVPHLVAEKRDLAKNKACKDGIAMAKIGDWNGALASWRSETASDPNNHAAFYNMGVAYEALKNYAFAKESYKIAVGLVDKKIYREALKNVQAIIEDESKLSVQMKGRNK